MGNLNFISFQPKKNGDFTGYLLLDEVFKEENSPGKIINNAIKTYRKFIKKMQLIIEKIQFIKKYNKPVFATIVWQVGDNILELISELEKQMLQIDDAYAHLMRDLKVSRNWLEKVIIFRRYIPRKSIIPKTLNWGKCRDAPRTIAGKLIKGIKIK